MIGGLAVALVSFADTSVLSRVYAARTRTNVDPNQEMGDSEPPTWLPDFFRAFPSAVAPRALPWRKLQELERS